MQHEFTEKPWTLLLAMYDLPSEKHAELRAALRRRHGKEGERWIRHQRSVVFVMTKETASGWYEWVTKWTGKDGGDRWLVVDITNSTYSGWGSKDVWTWLKKNQVIARTKHFLRDSEARRDERILRESQDTDEVKAAREALRLAVAQQNHRRLAEWKTKRAEEKQLQEHAKQLVTDVETMLNSKPDREQD
ncbi:hypothetical protein [Salinibacterium sp. ZJ450]|uniref:hypothetical protein n=1 Tax=Salinibacterium sp. ZJ450 TaxID=2708338 RepID=UPI00141E0B79|nr:hypothetical protein [Salinibacterium sp. ZJ450]